MELVEIIRHVKTILDLGKYGNALELMREDCFLVGFLRIIALENDRKHEKHSKYDKLFVLREKWFVQDVDCELDLGEIDSKLFGLGNIAKEECCEDIETGDIVKIRMSSGKWLECWYLLCCFFQEMGDIGRMMVCKRVLCKALKDVGLEEIDLGKIDAKVFSEYQRRCLEKRIGKGEGMRKYSQEDVFRMRDLFVLGNGLEDGLKRVQDMGFSIGNLQQLRSLFYRRLGYEGTREVLETVTSPHHSRSSLPRP